MNAFFPLIAVLVWSVNSIVIKMSADVIDPASISFYRWLIAFIILTPFLLKQTLKEFNIVKKHFFKFLVLGCLGMFLYQSLAYYAAQSATASLIGIANGIIPLITMIFSLWVLRVPPTLGLLIGGFLSFVGLILIISHGNPLDLIQNGVGIGELLLLGASISYALFGVLLKKWQIPVSQGTSLYMQIFCGLLCLLPLFCIESTTTLNADNISLVLYAAIFASIVAPFTWMVGIVRLGANKCAIFLNLAPLFTAVIAFFFLGEQLDLSFVIGGILVLAGVLTAQLFKRKLVK